MKKGIRERFCLRLNAEELECGGLGGFGRSISCRHLWCIWKNKVWQYYNLIYKIKRLVGPPIKMLNIL